jgi:signal transduction histidine kinase
VGEATLRDYATFAEWELGRRIDASVGRAMRMALLPATLWRVPLGGGAELDPVAELERFEFGVRGSLLSCHCPDAVDDFFFLDLPTGELTIGGEVTPEYRWWLIEAVEREPASFLRDPVVASSRSTAAEGGRMMVLQFQTGSDQAGVGTVPLDARRSVVFSHVRRDEHRRVYGFTVDAPRLLEPLVLAEIAASPLLPPALVGTAENTDVLAMKVALGDGHVIYRSGVEPRPDLLAVDTLALPVGRVTLAMSVRPEVAGSLVIGGLPRSRLPLLLGSLGLTLLLTLAALAQIRRQQLFFRSRAEFVSGVSHELRTPLAQIRLFSDLLASGRLEPAQRERSLRILTEESKRLTYLVDNVLRFSRAERGDDRITPVPTDLGALVTGIVEDFAPLARSREVRIEVSADGSVVAPVDPDAIRQVVLNLLDNAVKYGPRGERVTVRVMAKGDAARIEVGDGGPGVPPADRERIWDPYRRLARPAEESTGGSGIGLAVVREIVTRHGGRAWVEEGDPGAVFIVHLPLSPGSGGDDPVRGEAAAAEDPALPVERRSARREASLAGSPGRSESAGP